MLAVNHKIMIRNTGMLFVRMLFAMSVTLYTSRVVLDVLGTEDYGIYYVVAGFVLLLGFLQGAMTIATQRYFSFELGEGGRRLSEVFSTSVNIHVILAFLVVIIAETLGLYFVYSQLTIPVNRVNAAVWVYHFSVISFGLSILMVPFTALIMAHERMGVFAVVSMFDVVLKLLAVVMLQFSDNDKLIMYGFCMFVVAFVIFIIYIIYYIKSFERVKYKVAWDWPQFKIMMSYTLWNTWGNLAAVMSGQGINVLLNIFFGSKVNAARAISYQANTALTSFIQSVQSAINPQIIKQFAANNLKQMHELILFGARFNFYLLFLVSFPVMLKAEYLLSIWLVNVPEYSEVFLRLIIVHSLIYSLSGTLMTAAQATGRIKLYQAVVGGVLLLNLPISYYLLLCGFGPEVVIVVAILLEIISLALRMLLILPLIDMNGISFLNIVIFRAVAVTSLSVPLPVLMHLNSSDNFPGLIGVVASSMFCLTLSVWFVGLLLHEKQYAKNAVKKVLLKYC